MNQFTKIICVAGLVGFALIANAETNTLDVETFIDEPVVDTPETTEVKPTPAPTAVPGQIKQKIQNTREIEEQQRLKKMELQNTKPIPTPGAKATTTPVREKLMEMKRETNQMKMEVKDKLATTANQIKDRLMTRTTASSTERTKTALQNNVRNMLNRFTAAIERLNVLAEKIRNHIDRLAEAGRDVADAKEALATAETDISEASTSLADLKTALETALNSENPKETLTKIRQLSEETKSKIKEAHESLIDVVNILKPGTRKQIEQANQATTTTTTE
jgi:chromosome segregation ATPase